MLKYEPGVKLFRWHTQYDNSIPTIQELEVLSYVTTRYAGGVEEKHHTDIDNEIIDLNQVYETREGAIQALLTSLHWRV